MLDKWITFIKVHEKMLLVFAGLAVLGLLVNKYENLVHDADVGRNAIAQQQLAAQVEQNKQLASQIETQRQDYAKLAAQLQQQNTALLATIAGRNQQTTAQQHTDATLSQEALALRWSQLISVPMSEIVVVDKRTSVSEQVALTTVQTLEEVAPLKTTVSDQTTIINNKDAQITGLAGLNTSLTAQVLGLDKTLVDEKNACTAQVNLVKSKARKSKLRWFGIGVGTGVALVVKFAIL